ncbi:MAG: IS66 family insertion sequence element accessory protein TnpB [Rikenellaceae bacterium]
MYGSSVDMRKGIKSLYFIVNQSEELKATSGDVFVFVSNNRKSIKLLRWHNEGFVLYHKRLEVGVYNISYRLLPDSFVELSSESIDRIVSKIQHRSYNNELRHYAMLNV